MSHVAFLKTDLSRVRFVADGADAMWTAPEFSEEGASAAALRMRAADGAGWLNAQPEVRRRISAAVLDVDDALCAWVKAPSDARPVLSAAVRSLMQEWGDEHLADAVEPLNYRERIQQGVASRSPLLRKLRALGKRDGEDNAAPDGVEPLAPHQQGVALPVIALPDALTRLWLDALDRRSVKVARVMTLWHALPVAWNDASSPATTAVLLIDEGRLVWAWAEGHDLLAGGAVELDRPRPPQDDAPAGEPEMHRPAACTRLALDWLTWSSQLGRTPDRVVIVGPDCAAWAEALAGQWADIEVERIEQPNAIGATLQSIASAPIESAPDSARRCLEGLTHRPTRALRARYRLAGAAMLLLLVAVSSVAFRLSQKADAWRTQANAIRDDARSAVRSAFPELEAGSVRDPVRAARTQVQNWLGQDELQMPPQPREVLLELVRVVDILAEPEAEVRLLEIELDQDRNNELRYRVPDRQLAAEILQKLGSSPDRFVDWQRRPRDPDPLSPTLTGDWILEK